MSRSGEKSNPLSAPTAWLADVTSPCSVLVVDDDRAILMLLERRLLRHGCQCQCVDRADQALALMSEKPFDVLVTDLRMPGMSGIALLKALAETDLDIVPIVITGDGTISDAVEAVKLGAFDFIEKPQGVERLESTVDRAYRHKHLRRYAATMAETALHWETTFDAVPDLISIVDTAGRMVRVNKPMADRVGLAPRDAVGRPYEEVLGNNGTAGVRSLHTANADELSRIYTDVFAAAFLVTTSPLVSAQGETMGAVHVARDVNDARKAEIQLREAHEETEGLLASMSYFLIGLDADRRVSRWNAAAQETFGIAPEDATGKEFRWCGIRWDWEIMEDALPQCATSGRAVKLPDVRYTKPDHSEGILDVTINPVWTASGDAKGISLIGNDVTARKNLETQLLHAQKLESIGHLASGIAHEINTPIQYIGDNIRFLQDSFQDLFTLVDEFTRLTEAAASAEFERKILDSIQDVSETIDLSYLIEQIPKAIGDSLDGVERVASIVSAMKEFSHPGGAEKTPVNLNRAIESTITVARNEWKYLADVDAIFESDAPTVSCLPGEFNQVILNILINAAHAIGDVVGDGSRGKGKITVATRSDHDWFEVRISDTGSGIPEEIHGRIFDPFFTTKGVGRGTGQGLAIAHNVIVEKHRGTLTFETETGKGTTFIIRIPIDG